jgi:hypothetical protein
MFHYRKKIKAPKFEALTYKHPSDLLNEMLQ